MLADPDAAVVHAEASAHGAVVAVRVLAPPAASVRHASPVRDHVLLAVIDAAARAAAMCRAKSSTARAARAMRDPAWPAMAPGGRGARVELFVVVLCRGVRAQVLVLGSTSALHGWRIRCSRATIHGLLALDRKHVRMTIPPTADGLRLVVSSKEMEGACRAALGELRAAEARARAKRMAQ